MAETKIVFTKKIAIKLRGMGFKIVKVEPNFKKPQFDVYHFKNTPQLEKAFAEIVSNREVVK